jgi:hypothetical protein
MARTRTIKPAFAHAPSMLRVDRETRLLFVLLWTIADDEGRLRGSVAGLAAQLFPIDSDALMFLATWLDALEREGCIERYTVEEIEYLRIANWHDHQYIRHPTPSSLPPAPNERSRDSRKAREHSRTPRENAPNELDDKDLSAIHAKLAEIVGDDSAAGEVTGDKVMHTVDVILQASALDRNYATALRAAELKGRSIGLWATRRAAKGKAASSGEPPAASPPLSELHGMRKTEDTGAGDIPR